MSADLVATGKGTCLDPFTTGNPFLRTKLLGFSIGRGSGALKGLISMKSCMPYRTFDTPGIAYQPCSCLTLLYDCGRCSGHYARTGCGTGSHGDGDRPVLLQAVDENKDQTYFLCGVPSSALAKVTGNGNGDVSDDGNGIGSGWCWLW